MTLVDFISMWPFVGATNFFLTAQIQSSQLHRNQGIKVFYKGTWKIEVICECPLTARANLEYMYYMYEMQKGNPSSNIMYLFSLFSQTIFVDFVLNKDRF